MDDPKSFLAYMQQMIGKNQLYFFIIFIIIAVYLSVFLFGKNNLFEKEVEKVIDKETGMKIDFTPGH